MSSETGEKVEILIDVFEATNLANALKSMLQDAELRECAYSSINIRQMEGGYFLTIVPSYNLVGDKIEK